MGDWDPYADDPQGPRAEEAYEVPDSNIKLPMDDVKRMFDHLFGRLHGEAPWDRVPSPKPDLSWHEPTCTLEAWSHTDVKCALGAGIVYFTLNRPQDGNKLTAGILAALADAAVLLHRRTDLRVAVFSGEGALLCGGGDPSGEAGSGLVPPSGSADQGVCEAMAQRALDMGVFADGQAGLPRLLQAVLWRTLATVPQFSVCVANGSAMGEGLGFLACCDYTVAVEGSFLSPADIHYGLVPAVLAPYILNKMGTGATKRLFCTCENISAERAVTDGLVDDVAPSLEAAHGLVRGLCERLTGCGPRSVDAAKELVAGVSGQQITEPLMFYTCAFAQRALASEEAQQAARAAGGRKPWEGVAIQPLH